jgi:23S rRNA U2552 (ribose-2'-O)-methylase RlmE/FtsJ
LQFLSNYIHGKPTSTRTANSSQLQIHPQINPLQANINANSSTEQINQLQSQHQSTTTIQIHPQINPLQANINANSSTEQINQLQSQHQSTTTIQIHPFLHHKLT